eukprot:scaffold212244_cov19-Tisochrysis_lutea.AAC.1
MPAVQWLEHASMHPHGTQLNASTEGKSSVGACAGAQPCLLRAPIQRAGRDEGLSRYWRTELCGPSATPFWLVQLHIPIMGLSLIRSCVRVCTCAVNACGSCLAHAPQDKRKAFFGALPKQFLTVLMKPVRTLVMTAAAACLCAQLPLR